MATKPGKSPSRLAYKVIAERYRIDLEATVAEYIAQGWAPLGGVSVSLAYTPGSSQEQIWAQAMIKQSR